jgi:hypothetical protein
MSVEPISKRKVPHVSHSRSNRPGAPAGEVARNAIGSFVFLIIVLVIVIAMFARG